MDKQKLILEKTNDHCVSGESRLAVVMIHGIASNSSTFNGLMEYLRGRPKLRDVRVITYDLLGAGRSYTDDKLNYNYKEQTTALSNALKELELGDMPLVLVGHSMGTLIVTRYANMHPRAAKRLILISPPVYTEEDLDDPIFKLALNAFRDVVGRRDSQIVEEKPFNASMEEIVKNRENYQNLVKLKTPTTMIYGAKDQIVASFNYPELLEQNTHLTAVETAGGHGISHDKYEEVAKAIGEVMEEMEEKS